MWVGCEGDAEFGNAFLVTNDDHILLYKQLTGRLWNKLSIETASCPPQRFHRQRRMSTLTSTVSTTLASVHQFHRLILPFPSYLSTSYPKAKAKHSWDPRKSSGLFDAPLLRSAYSESHSSSAFPSVPHRSIAF